jgi:hypothetical protein
MAIRMGVSLSSALMPDMVVGVLHEQLDGAGQPHLRLGVTGRSGRAQPWKAPVLS